MAHKTLIHPLAACLFLALTSPLLAAQPAAVDAPPPPAADKIAISEKAAGVCAADLKAFDGQMEKDGYWVAGGGYGFGYPMGEAGYGMYGSELPSNDRAFAGLAYHNARPGYEVRALVDAANILARHDQQQACEDVLAETQTLYKRFLVDMQKGGNPIADMPGWRTRQIHAAKAVAGANIAFRSDQLLGVEVRSPNGLGLGSVDDIVLSPKTGAIAYLVIASGGIFGFDENRFPVPWADFKATTTASLLVLDTTATVLEGAPKVNKNSFSVSEGVGGDSGRVDAYWKAHQPSTASN